MRRFMFLFVLLLIVGTVLSFYLWKASAIPKLSYNVVRIPMNELQDEEWFNVEEEAWRSPTLIFSQRLYFSHILL